METRKTDPVSALEHVLTEVLKNPICSDPALTGPFRRAMDAAGVSEIGDLCMLRDEDFREIEIPDFVRFGEEKDTSFIYSEHTRHLTMVERRTFEQLLLWFRDKSLAKSDIISPSRVWFLLTTDEFNTWKKTYHPPMSSNEPSSIGGDYEVVTIEKEQKRDLENFKKGVKRDESAFKVFKEDQYYLNFHRNLLVTARSQNVERAFDLDFDPSTLDKLERELYDQQMKFAYSVLNKIVQTSQGRIFVRQHEKDGDATAVLRKIITFYTESRVAEKSSSDLLAKILALRFDSTWNSGAKNFLNHWQNLVLDLEEIRGTGSPVAVTEKRPWLVTSLSTNSEMQSAITQWDSSERMLKLGVIGSGILSVTKSIITEEVQYAGFIQHLETTAANYDASHKATRSTRRQANATDRRGNPDKKVGEKGPNWIPEEKFATMTWDEKKAHWAKLKKQQKSANVAKSTTTKELAKAVQAALVTEREANATKIEKEVEKVAPKEIVIKVAEGTAAADDTPAITLKSLLKTHKAEGKMTITESNGHHFLQIDMANRLYTVVHAVTSSLGALIDRGANGGIGGADMRIIETLLNAKADVSGIGSNVLKDLPIVTGACKVKTHRGYVIGLFPQFAYDGAGKTIISALQMEAWGLDVDERPRKAARNPGKQRIITPDGYKIPLKYRNGLPYMDITYPTDDDMELYPHVFFTKDDAWDPTIIDDEYESEVSETEEDELTYNSEVNDYGELTGDIERDIDVLLLEVHSTRVANDREVITQKPKFEALRPNFGWISVERLKKTLAATTQYARAMGRIPFRKHYKTRFPAANVRRFNDDVATDTFFADTPAIDDGIRGHGGSTMAQIYCGKKTQLTAAFPMKSETEMPATLQDFIRKEGAPNLLFSDNAKVQIGKTVNSILRHYGIDDHQSEPYHQHQNYAERRIQEIKRFVDVLMDRTGTPAGYWLLCLLYAVYLLNRLASDSLGGISAIQAAHNWIPDVSALLTFYWWQPVYYATNDGASGFPSESKEKLGRWVGVAESKGDILTYWILTEDTHMVIPRSAVRPVTVEDPNMRSMPQGGEDENRDEPILKSVADLKQPTEDPCTMELPSFSPEDLLGVTFLRDAEEDGRVLRAKIVREIKKKDSETKTELLKFVVEIGDNEYDEIMTYNELCDIIEQQQEAEEAGLTEIHAYRDFVGHDGPLKSNDPKYNGSTWNLLVHWEDGTQSWEPLDILAKDDPVSCARYGRDKDLLDKPGWKRLKKIASRKKKFDRMINQSKVAPSRNVPLYKFGVELPRNIHALEALDKKNGNMKWDEACTTEISCLDRYKTFLDKGKNTPTPEGFKRIRLHWVFDVKQDLRHRARLVALGNLTEVPKDSTYSGVVSLRSLRMCILIAELNDLKVQAADISSAYLEAYTKEKVCFTAGPEFKELQGHTIIIIKALYGLRTSGARWHEKLADSLYDLGFKPCKSDPDVWMKNCGSYYEYVCVYVDDLAVMMKDPDKFFVDLKKQGGYGLKGEGEIKYHIGGDFFRDPDGTLVYSAKTYVDRMLANYQRLFGNMPKEYITPLDANDHPELDTSPELDEKGKAIYMSLIGCMQWAVSLCRYDIGCAIMTMGRFRNAPREGHLERIKHMCGYLKKYKSGGIRFRTDMPEYGHLEEPTVDWTHSVYGDVKEDIPDDMPEPKGKPVRLTCFVDANLMHDFITGRSATGILHLMNLTPIDWFSKRQDTVETATYGSEFVAARIATEQVMDIRTTLRYMGVPIEEKTFMFGDNASVITSSTIQTSVLKKRHNMLAYHRVREAIAAGVMFFFHIPGTENPSDVLTKNLTHTVAWKLIRPFLFYAGDMSTA